MTIFLDNSLITSLEAKRIRILKCIRNLCIVFEESKHYLLGELNVLKWANEQSSEEVVKRMTRHLLANYSTTNIPTGVNEYIVVGDWDSKIVEMDGNGKTVHKVPYNFFLDSSSCQSSLLFGEDYNDSNLYELILIWYKHEHNLRQQHVLNPKHGGGGRTEECIRNELNHQKIGVAVIDTDVRFPGDVIDEESTLKKCQVVENEIKDFTIFHLHKLNVHEIENILPFEIMLGLDWNLDNKVKMEYLINSPDAENIMRYYDIKSGIRSRSKNKDKIRDVHDTSSHIHQFACKCFKIQNPGKKDHDFIAHLNNTDENFASIGLGRPLDKVINILKNDLDKLYTATLMDFQRSEWEQLGKTLYSYGVARSNEPIN